MDMLRGSTNTMPSYLIVGFGRMGVTHLAHILGNLQGDAVVDIFDPSMQFRALANFRVRKHFRFLRRMPNAGIYEGVFITSPPNFHQQNFESTIQLSDRFFIEKPLRVASDILLEALNAGKRIACGYVLPYNPCVAFVRSILETHSPDTIFVEVKSNVGLQKTDDWRFKLASGGGCLHELGSHALHLALTLTPGRTKGGEISGADATVRAVDDDSFHFLFGNAPEIQVRGSWLQDVRKTTYTVVAEGPAFRLETDMQSVMGAVSDDRIDWSPRVSPQSVRYYLRGLDFALQSSAFLDDTFNAGAIWNAHLTDVILESIEKHV